MATTIPDKKRHDNFSAIDIKQERINDDSNYDRCLDDWGHFRWPLLSPANSANSDCGGRYLIGGRPRPPIRCVFKRLATHIPITLSNNVIEVGSGTGVIAIVVKNGKGLVDPIRDARPV